MPFHITRPAEGICLNAGFPEFIVDEVGEVMTFDTRGHAISWLAEHDVQEDELGDMLIEVVYIPRSNRGDST